MNYLFWVDSVNLLQLDSLHWKILVHLLQRQRKWCGFREKAFKMLDINKLFFKFFVKDVTKTFCPFHEHRKDPRMSWVKVVHKEILWNVLRLAITRVLATIWTLFSFTVWKKQNTYLQKEASHFFFFLLKYSILKVV